jgi:copper chaperone CopZ
MRGKSCAIKSAFSDPCHATTNKEHNKYLKCKCVLKNMKAIIINIILVMTLLSTSSAEMRHVVFKAEISSEIDINNISEKLSETDGIVEYFVDHNSNMITIKFDDEKINIEDIKSSISNLGFKPKLLKAKKEKQVDNIPAVKADTSKTENCCGR